MFLSQRRDLKRKRSTDERDLVLPSWDTAHQESALSWVPHPCSPRCARHRATGSEPCSDLENSKLGPLHPRALPCSLRRVRTAFTNSPLQDKHRQEATAGGGRRCRGRRSWEPRSPLCGDRRAGAGSSTAAARDAGGPGRLRSAVLDPSVRDTAGT